ncbi:phasin family protein [Azospirillum sp. sgz301742]
MATKPTGNPFFDVDFSKVLTDLKVPGIDVDAILATQRKNIEAVTAANQLAIEGLQAVLRRQAEIVRQSLEAAGSAATEVIAAGSPEDKAAKQAELIKATFEKSLSNIRELSEMVAKSNSEAADVLAKRVSESLDEVKSAIAGAKAKAGKK